MGFLTEEQRNKLQSAEIVTASPAQTGGELFATRPPDLPTQTIAPGAGSVFSRDPAGAPIEVSSNTSPPVKPGNLEDVADTWFSRRALREVTGKGVDDDLTESFRKHAPAFQNDPIDDDGFANAYEQRRRLYAKVASVVGDGDPRESMRSLAGIIAHSGENQMFSPEDVQRLPGAVRDIAESRRKAKKGGYWPKFKRAINEGLGDIRDSMETFAAVVGRDMPSGGMLEEDAQRVQEMRREIPLYKDLVAAYDSGDPIHDKDTPKLQRWTLDAARMSPAMTAGMTGKPLAAATFWFMPIFDDEYHAMRRRGVKEDTAIKTGALSAITQAAVETLNMNPFLPKGFKGDVNKLARNWVTQRMTGYGKEGLEEHVQGFVSAVTDMATRGDSKAPPYVWEDFRRQVVDQPLEAWGPLAVMMAPGTLGSLPRGIKNHRAAERAKAWSQAFEDANTIAAQPPPPIKLTKDDLLTPEGAARAAEILGPERARQIADKGTMSRKELAELTDDRMLKPERDRLAQSLQREVIRADIVKNQDRYLFHTSNVGQEINREGLRYGGLSGMPLGRQYGDYVHVFKRSDLPQDIGNLNDVTLNEVYKPIKPIETFTAEELGLGYEQDARAQELGIELEPEMPPSDQQVQKPKSQIPDQQEFIKQRIKERLPEAIKNEPLPTLTKAEKRAGFNAENRRHGAAEGKIREEALGDWFDLAEDEYIKGREVYGFRPMWAQPFEQFAMEVRGEQRLRDEKARHREIVKQAVIDGKPIPPEVLADYPDLKSGKGEGQTQEVVQPTTADRLREAVDEQNRGVVRAVAAPPIQLDSVPEFEQSIAHPEPRVEAAIKRAKGMDVPSLSQKVKDAAKDLYHMATRSFIDIDKKKFGAAHDIMRRARDVARIASDNAIRDIQAITAPLEGPRQLDLFARKLIAENQIASYDRDEPLRFESGEIQGWLDMRDKLDGVIAQVPQVAKAIQNRTAMIEARVGQLVDAGLLNPSAMDNAKRYYHQQVLTYANLKRRFGAAGVVQGKKGFQKKRVAGVEQLGPEYDYNTDYIQSEAEWMTDANAKLAADQLLRDLGRVYDVLPNLKQMAKDDNFENLVGGPEVVERIASLKDEQQELRAVLAMQEADASEVRPRLGQIGEELDAIDPTRPAAKQMAKGYAILEQEGIQTGELSSETLRQMARDGDSDKIRAGASTVLAGMSQRQQIIREGLGSRFQTWEDYVPKGHTAFQPEPGNVFYKAYTIPERIIEEAERRGALEMVVSQDDIRQALAMGGKKPYMVVPDAIASQMSRMEKARPKGAWGKAVSSLMSQWKRWSLLQPKRAIAYNIRNTTGDIDPVIAGAPAVLKLAPQSAADLWRYGIQRQLRPKPYVQDAHDLGVIDSTFAVQELPESQDIKEFERFYKEVSATGIANIPANTWKLYFDNVQQFTNFRENVMRLAAYKYALRQIQKGRPLRAAAVPRETLNDIRKNLGNKEAAAYWARNLIGDYGDITIMGDWLRSRLLPFWSFQEINLKRYPRLALNALQEGRPGSAAGAAAVGAARAVLFSRLFWLYGGFWAFNNLMFPDKEDGLGTFDQQNPHLVLCRNPDGSIRVFRNVGAMGEFLEFFGLNTALSLARRTADGQISGTDLVKEMAADPMNKVVQGMGPVKGIVETSAGQTWFPDFRAPRAIERDFSAAQIMGLGDEYNAVKGHILKDGTRARPNWAGRIMTGIADPRKNALYEMMSLKDDFSGKKGLEIYPISKHRKMRLAAENEDYDAFMEARAKYISDGNTYVNLTAYLGRLDPLRGLNDLDEREFVNEYLNDRQRDKLNIARRYSKELELTMWSWWRRASENDPPELQKQVRAQLRSKRKQARQRGENGKKAREWLRERGL